MVIPSLTLDLFPLSCFCLLYPSAFVLFLMPLSFEAESHPVAIQPGTTYVDQAVFKLEVILLPLLPEC